MEIESKELGESSSEVLYPGEIQGVNVDNKIYGYPLGDN